MFARLLGIRKEDRRDTTVAFLTLLGTMTAHTLLETARDALFLSRLPARVLPWAYIAIALLSLGINTASRGLRAVVPRRMILTIPLLGGGLVTAAFYWFVSQSPAMLLSFYVWTGLLASIVVVEFWLLVAQVVDFGQAKRIFSVVAAGGLLGAVLGAALASGLLMAMPPSYLLLVAAGIFGVTSVVPMFFSRARPPPNRRASTPASSWVATLRSDPYLRRLLRAAFASSMLVTGVDFVFKAMASVDLAPDQLAPFFARFYGIISGVALLVQVFLAPRILRTLGVNGSLLILPALLLLGSSGFVLTGGLGAAILMRGADGALRHSLHRTGTEILYVPISPWVRDRFKSFVEAVGQRGGQGLASVLLLGAVAAHIQPMDIGFALVALAGVWLFTTIGIKPHYLELFRRNLREGALETHVEVPDLDLHSLEALIGALSSHNDHEVRASLDLLAAYGKTNLVPALILYHPSSDVVLRAFELFAGSDRADVDRLVDRLIGHDDQRVRAAALRYSAPRTDTEFLRSMSEDPSPLVRATALVELVRQGAMDETEASNLLRGIIDRGTPALRLGLAYAARDLPKGRYSWVLVRLGMLREPGLAVEVARSMAATPDVEHVPTLVRLLGERDCREDARAAILALGEPALGALTEALSDSTLPRAVRRNLPRTLSRFGGNVAAATLERRIPIETDEVVEQKLVRSLGKMRAADPTITVDRRLLLAEARRALERAITLVFWQIVIERVGREDPTRRSPAGEMLGALLGDKETSAIERLFRLLKVLDPSEDFEVILTSLRSTDSRARENGRELLTHVVPEQLRGAVLALLADVPREIRLREATRFFDPKGRDRLELAALRLAQATGGQRRDALYELEAIHVECLRAMLLDPSDALRGVARYRIAELGIDQLEPELLSSPGDQDSAIAELSEHAVDLFSRRLAGATRAG